MAALKRLVVVAAVIAFAVWCGDPLVDAAFPGASRLTVRGNVTGNARELDDRRPPGETDSRARVALFWNPAGTELTQLDQLVEARGTNVLAAVPFSYQLEIYDLPGEGAFVERGLPGNYAIGIVAAYSDRNDDGIRQADEPFVGLAGGAAIVYAAEDLDATETPTGRPLGQGFHHVSLPMACAKIPNIPRGTEECGVPVGEKCRHDSDCGENGFCVLQYRDPYPSGACTVKAPHGRRTCEPAGTVQYSEPSSDYNIWMPACETDADCTRGYPYVCDHNTGACLPTGPMNVEVSDEPNVRRFCIEDKPEGEGPPDGGGPPPDGGRPLPPDGGQPPPPDGGPPPPPDGGSSADAGTCPAPPPKPDGTCPGPPEQGGSVPARPDGTCPPPPPRPDGSCPPPPTGP